MHFQNILFSLIFLLASVQLNAQENYTLKEALKYAKENSPYLKAAHINIAMGEAEITTAKLRPNLNLTNESIQVINSKHFPDNATWRHGENREIFWELSKPLQLAGQRRHKIDFAKKNLSSIEKTYSETERNLFLEVANKWLELWTVEKQLEILQIAKANIDSLSFINQKRFESEVISKTELQRTELLSKQYEIQYEIMQKEVSNEKKELALLLGFENEISIDTADNFLISIPQGIKELIAQSIENRSDMQLAKSVIELSNSNLKLQKASAYPETELGMIYNPQGAVPFLGFSFSIDLPVFNRNQGEIRRAYLEIDQAEQEIQMLEREIKTEVAIAYSDYKLHEQNLEKFKELLQQSAVILESVKQSYLRGGTNIIDFLEAQRSWLEIQQEHYDALQTFKQSYVRMLYTTGLINQLAL